MPKVKSDDPVYRMLHDDERTTTPTVFEEGCSICEDPEFARMGLPLCYACRFCSGHVAADDCECDECGRDQRDE